MDFMHDQLPDGRSLRLFNMIDNFNRDALAMDIDLSLPVERAVRALGQVIKWRGKPQTIRSDNGPEYTSIMLLLWAEKHGIRLEHIQPINPQRNAYVEWYNRTVRYDWLGITCSSPSLMCRCSGLLIPSFSIGRTQGFLYELEGIIHRKLNVTHATLTPLLPLGERAGVRGEPSGEAYSNDQAEIACPTLPIILDSPWPAAFPRSIAS